MLTNKLTNKQKQAIRQALFSQIENIMENHVNKTGYEIPGCDDIDPQEIERYLYKIVGLFPS